MEDRMEKSDAKHIRLYLAHGESGWGELLDDGTVKILNNALMSELCVGDIVEVEWNEGGLPDITKVISQHMYCKFAVTYMNIDDYKAFRTACIEAYDPRDIAMEGLVPPKNGSPGIAMVSCVDDSIYELLDDHPGVVRAVDDEDEDAADEEE